ncbi:MAG TPA: hypothetical protein VFQ26_07825 [Nitrospiraceae bacterium]|nr:hypothetical protein [Nitrospiraceae bacterium]
MITSKISKIGIYHLKSEDHEKKSVLTVTEAGLVDAAGAPIPGGVCDSRLGVANNSTKICGTCHLSGYMCPGHRGVIRLGSHIIDPIAISEVKYWLNVVCYNCGESLVPKSKLINVVPFRRLQEASSMATALYKSKNKFCSECSQHVAFRVKQQKRGDGGGGARDLSTAKYRFVSTHDDTIQFTPKMILAILSKIPKSLVSFMGRTQNCHPQNFILDTICVTSNTSRPIIHLMGSNVGQFDDLTNIMHRILKDSYSSLSQQETKKTKTANRIVNLITMAIAAFKSDYGYTGTKKTSSFLGDMGTKLGLIRGNLLGSRTSLICRCTLSGDMTIRINEIGIPLYIAKRLYVEETVHDYNYDRLSVIFVNGQTRYPGCRSVRKKNAQLLDLSLNFVQKLEIGDVVHRHIVTGDYIFINRQPSLLMSSMGVHRVVVIEDSTSYTIRMNIGSCKWLGADFDGDMVLAWTPHTKSTLAEAKVLARVGSHVISNQYSNTIIGQVQDGVVGSFEISRPGVVVSKRRALHIASHVNGVSILAEGGGSDGVSGKSIVSQILKKWPVSLKIPTRVFKSFGPYFSTSAELSDMKELVINNGVIESGVLDKNSVGEESSRGITHLISRLHSVESAMDFTYELQHVALKYLMYNGFTISLGDFVVSENTRELINHVVGVTFNRAVLLNRLLVSSTNNSLRIQSRDFYEKCVMNALSLDTTLLLTTVLKDIDPKSNGLYKLVATGSKGSLLNFVHMIGAIGQTKLSGDRIANVVVDKQKKFGMFSDNRTLIYFPQFSLDPLAYGFCQNSYITGLSLSEFIAEAQKARVDLISKALKTAESGSFHRGYVVANQSTIINNRRQVVKADRVIQFLYGETGFNPSNVEKVVIPIRISNDVIKSKRYPEWYESYLIKTKLEYFRRFVTNSTHILYNGENHTENYMPLNVANTINLLLHKEEESGRVENDDTVEDRLRYIKSEVEALPYNHYNSQWKAAEGDVLAYFKHATFSFKAYILFDLMKFDIAKLTLRLLSVFFEFVTFKFKTALVPYGASVGIWFSQAAGEPLTQQLLNSIHSNTAGGGSSSGISRANEIFYLRAEMKNPQIECVVPDKQVNMTALSYIKLGDRLSSETITYESPNDLRFFKEDSVWLAKYREHSLVDYADDDSLTRFCYRAIVSGVDAGRCDKGGVDMERAVMQIEDLYVGKKQKRVNNAFWVTYGRLETGEVVMRVWLKITQLVVNIPFIGFAYVEELFSQMKEIVHCGIDGLSNHKYETKLLYVETDDGEFRSESVPYLRVFTANTESALLHLDMDTRYFYSASIMDMYSLYGIEAARETYLKEICKLTADNLINKAHLLYCVDEMCRLGRPTPITRSHLGALDAQSALVKIASGDSSRNLITAALRNQTSLTSDLLSSSIMGGVPESGSRYNPITINEDFVKKNSTYSTLDSAFDDL